MGWNRDGLMGREWTGRDGVGSGRYGTDGTGLGW